MKNQEQAIGTVSTASQRAAVINALISGERISRGDLNRGKVKGLNGKRICINERCMGYAEKILERVGVELKKEQIGEKGKQGWHYNYFIRRCDVSKAKKVLGV